MLALIDCNNFFVSCERLFRPDLEGKPVVSLSSNDGCVIARSNEAKDIGIPMGAPVFKYRDVFTQHRVVSFSANFELYGDISKRITNLLREITPRIETYSIDESFLDITTLKITDYEAWGRMVSARIKREIGVPVSIGIAPTKTLAKLASELCKRDASRKGTFLLQPGTDSYVAALQQTDIKKLWGIGRRLEPRMKREGVFTAWQFANIRPQHAQQLLGIHGRQMVAELNGTRCIPFTQQHKPRKSIMKGRTFGEDTDQKHVIESAIATLTNQATFRLRSEHQLTRRASLIIETSRFKPGYRRWYCEEVFLAPTADTGQIITALFQQFQTIHRPNQLYHRTNVLLHDFTTNSQIQADVFGSIDLVAHDRNARRMVAIDAINNRYGRASILYAAENLSRTWQPKKRLQSPAYTTKWPEIPSARILSP